MNYTLIFFALKPSSSVLNHLKSIQEKKMFGNFREDVHLGVQDPEAALIIQDY